MESDQLVVNGEFSLSLEGGPVDSVDSHEHRALVHVLLGYVRAATTRRQTAVERRRHMYDSQGQNPPVPESGLGF